MKTILAFAAAQQNDPVADCLLGFIAGMLVLIFAVLVFRKKK
jgi:hypothetical protein